MIDDARRDELYTLQAHADQAAVNLGAGAISLLIILSVAGDLERLAIAIALHAIVVPMNIAWTRFLVPRFGPRTEVARTLVNQIVCWIGYSMIGWPLPVWLWLPYCGLVFDQWGGKHTLIVMVIMCAFQGTAGVIYGVSPIYPVTFTLLAIVCWSLTARRLAVMRDMLVRSDAQRVELARAHQELLAETAARHAVELELRQAQKLEAIGRLAAGVAHEINTPLQFVGDNLQFVSEGVDGLLALCDRYSAAAASSTGRDTALEEASAYAEEIDVGYLNSELTGSLQLVSEGVGRVTKIVRSMRQFAHPDGESGSFDLGSAIETTLTIAKHEYKLVADVELRLAETPPVIGNQGEINQVLLNLVVNAAHAIEDVVGSSGARGLITIATAVEGDSVRVSVGDTGSGIPEQIRPRIFEPFFTTKEVGRGTGQGLAIARAVIDRHHGELTFETETGRGTTFHIRLPIRPAASLAAAA